jgi:L-ribulose-5-phosphate 3-epimerase
VTQQSPSPEDAKGAHFPHKLIHENTLKRIRIGIRAHDLGTCSAVELARRVRAIGLDCVQLALGKAIDGVDLRPGVLNSGMAMEIGDAFAQQGVRIEVLGCYINPIHPDRPTRIKLLDLFKEHLRHARDFGCNIVALESGSLNADQSFHPCNDDEAVYQDLHASMKELVAEAERCRVMIGIEAVTSHVISTPEKMRRLLDDIPSSHLKVVFDPVNLLSLENHTEQHEIMRRSFELFGSRMAVVHAKDFRITGGNLVACAPGEGVLDYPFLLSLIANHKPWIAILLEGVPADKAVACGRFILDQTLSPIS